MEDGLGIPLNTTVHFRPHSLGQTNVTPSGIILSIPSKNSPFSVNSLCMRLTAIKPNPTKSSHFFPRERPARILELERPACGFTKAALSPH